MPDTITTPATPAPDRILIHRNLWDSADECDRVQGLVNWVNRVLFESFYLPEEIPAHALQSYYVDYYLAQANNGGLSQFVFNSRWEPKTIASVVTGLSAMGAERHAKLFADLGKAVAALGDDLQKFLASEYFGTNDIRERLDALTDAFFALNKEDDLTKRNHAWIATFTEVDVADGEEFDRRWEAYERLDAVRTQRKAAAEKEAEENENPLQKLIRGWCTTTGRTFDHLTAIDMDGIHFFADGKKFTAKIDGAALAMHDADERKISVVPMPAELLRSDDQEDGDGPDGEIVNNSYSTNAPHVALDFKRLLRYDPELGGMVRTVHRAAAVFVLTLLGAIALFATGHWIIGLLLLPVLWFSGKIAVVIRMLPMLKKAMTQYFHSALLTPAVIEKTEPLTLVCLAAMGNGSGADFWGLKRMEIGALPLHQLRRGEIIPCVSVFQAGDADDHWVDFTPRPISWGTDDASKIKDLMKKLDPPDVEHLKRLMANGPLPKGTGKILLLDGRFTPVR